MNGLLDDYDPVPGLVARGVMSDEHDTESCEADCCNDLTGAVGSPYRDRQGDGADTGPRGSS